MKRRSFLSGAAVAGAAASTFPAPAIAKGSIRWLMVTTWPKNFPGLGTGANLLADLITKGSDGRLSVKVYGAGEIVPAFEAVDAVASGTADMGHGAPYYWKGKVAATQLIAALPFSLTAQEQNAWFQFGGSQELSDTVYKELGCKFFPSGNTGVQMGGWYNRKIESIDDYKGLKIRIPGLGGEVVKAAGANVVNLPGGEIPPALSSGAIDATEWVGPFNDLAFGLYKSAKYYYYPGWHEPGTVLDNFINLAQWEKLSDDLKAIVRAANATVNQRVLSEFVARNSIALARLTDEHGVALSKLPDPVLNALGALAGQVLSDISAKDSLSSKLFASLVDFRKKAIGWSRVLDQAYLTARALPFKFVE